MIDSLGLRVRCTVCGMTTPRSTGHHPEDQPLKIARWASLGLVLIAALSFALPAGQSIGPWLFALGLIGWLTTSVMLGWRESKRKEAAKLQRG